MVPKVGLLLIIVLFFFSCNQSDKTITVKKEVHHGVTSEVLKSGDYSIINFKENNAKSVWVATTLIHPTPQIGSIYFFTDGEMKVNYKFQDINRVFDTIYFVDKISIDPSVFGIAKNSEIKISQESIKPTLKKQKVNIEQSGNTITIETLFANKDSLSGKKVSIKGVVTKFNSDIMNKNWVHIQDGTSYQDIFDLTITTNQEAVVGDTIIATGEIVLNKDFGYGYFYPVLMENTIIK